MPIPRAERCAGTGALILNADDWGLDRETTERTFDCFRRRAISSVSAMVFMADSERSANLALENGIDAGLHLNLTAAFTAPRTPSRLMEHQAKVSKFLRSSSLARVLYHPGLTKSFEYLVAAQREEFARLYGEEPERLDGHHHMHLCSNVLMGEMLQPGITVRRNFYFRPGEKSLLNRTYRRIVDGGLARRYRLADYLFALPPVDQPDRLQRIFSLAKNFAVEVETHPVNPEEYRFLMDGEIVRIAGDVPIAPHYVTLHLDHVHTEAAGRG